MGELLKFSVEDARTILYGKSETYKVVSRTIKDARSCETYYRLIVKRLADNRYFKSTYSIWITEDQITEPWQNEGVVEFVEVFPVQKTITVYE